MAALLPLAAAGLLAGCRQDVIDSWERTTGTPLGTNGKPLVETGRLWTENTLTIPRKFIEVELRDGGHRVWGKPQVAQCERLILQTLALHEPWRSAGIPPERYAFPVTAYLVSTDPAVVVVVSIEHAAMSTMIADMTSVDLQRSRYRGLLGNLTQAESHVPAADLAAVYLPELGIGPIPLARGQSMRFPTPDGGICLAAGPDGWTATWITPEPLPEAWERVDKMYRNW